jgi:hypothetical protein
MLGARDVSLLRNVKSSSVAHSFPYSVEFGGFCPGIFSPRREVHHLPLPRAEVQN